MCKLASAIFPSSTYNQCINLFFWVTFLYLMDQWLPPSFRSGRFISTEHRSPTYSDLLILSIGGPPYLFAWCFFTPSQNKLSKLVSVVLAPTWNHPGLPLSDSEHPFVSGWIHPADVTSTLPCTSLRFILNFLNEILFLFWSVELILNTGSQRPLDAIFSSLVTSVYVVLPWNSHCASLPYQLFSTTFLTHFFVTFCTGLFLPAAVVLKETQRINAVHNDSRTTDSRKLRETEQLTNQWNGVKTEVKKVLKIFIIE